MRDQQALRGEKILVSQKIIDVNELLSVRRDMNNSTELLKKTDRIILLEED